MLDTLNQDLIAAMKNKDKLVLSVIRMTKAAVERVSLEKKRPLTDEEITTVIGKQIKTREDSIIEFEKGNRQDLITATNLEIEVLKKYMPSPLTDDAVNQIINDAITEVGATSIKDLGSLMKIITPLVKGKYDMGKINTLIKEKLS